MSENNVITAGLIACENCGKECKGERGLRSHGNSKKADGDCKAAVERYLTLSRIDAQVEAAGPEPIEDDSVPQPQDEVSNVDFGDSELHVQDEAPVEDESDKAAWVDEDLEKALQELAVQLAEGEGLAPASDKEAGEAVVAEAEKVTEEAAATEGNKVATAVADKPRNVQRMTLKVPLDVDLGAWSERFGVTGWMPIRESLQAYAEALLLNSPAVLDGQIVSAEVK
jgi:hypothetical protein